VDRPFRQELQPHEGSSETRHYYAETGDNILLQPHEGSSETGGAGVFALGRLGASTPRGFV